MNRPECVPDVKYVEMFGQIFKFAVYPDSAIEEVERKSNGNIEVVNSHKNPRVGGSDPPFKGGHGPCHHAQGSLPHGCLSTVTPRKKYYIYS